MMRRHGELLGLLLVVALILAISAVSHQEGGDASQMSKQTQVHSSYRISPEGYKALYDTLAAHYAVMRLIRPYGLLPARGLLIVADPYRQPISAYEAHKLHAWVAAGNHALVLVEQHPGNLFALAGVKVSDDPADPDDAKDSSELHWKKHPKFWEEDPWWAAHQAEVEAGNASAGTAEAHALAPTFLSVEAPALAVNSTLRFPRKALLPQALEKAMGGVAPVYADASGTVAAYSAIGRGGIVWCSSPWSLSNAGVANAQNLEFVLALANLQPNAPIIFDEYHHGYGAGMTLWNLAPRMVKLGIVQLALALLLLLMTVVWRFGPPRLPDDERFPRSRAEYLTAMAGLLERAQATHVVRERLSALLRRELGRRLAVAPHAPAERFLAANSRLQVVEHPALERIFQQLAAMDAQSRPDAGALYRLAWEIHRLLHKR